MDLSSIQKSINEIISRNNTSDRRGGLDARRCPYEKRELAAGLFVNYGQRKRHQKIMMSLRHHRFAGPGTPEGNATDLETLKRIVLRTVRHVGSPEEEASLCLEVERLVASKCQEGHAGDESKTMAAEGAFEFSPPTEPEEYLRYRRNSAESNMLNNNNNHNNNNEESMG